MAKRITYLLLLVIFMMNGCTLEQKLARTFVKSHKPAQFFLLKPSFVFKTNLKEFEIPGIESYDEFTRDSLLLENSLFLKSVSDSLLIDAFVLGFVKTLAGYNIEVMMENAVDTLMTNGGTPFIINIAQFSLEEYIHPYYNEAQVYDEIIVIEGIDLNALNYNIWIELGRMNTDKKNKVLFATDHLFDEIQGTLKRNLISGKMSFDYTIDTITNTQVVENAHRFGKIAASELFDYLMNDYISENLPENYPYEQYYYHYDPVRRLIYQVSDAEILLELDNY
jgi:hypothetical protein